MAASKVQIPLTKDGHEYLRAVLEGVLEGATGKVKVNPNYRHLVHGIYHALSGGTVDVTIATPGDPNQVKGYQRMEKESLKSSNKANQRHLHPIRVDI
jgi:hypothetical protein